MNKLLKHLILKLLNFFGYTIQKNDNEYAYLLKQKRRKPIDITLLNHKFKIADGKSFYYSYIEIFKRKRLSKDQTHLHGNTTF